MSTPGSVEAPGQAGVRRFVSGVVEGEQAGTRSPRLDPRTRGPGDQCERASCSSAAHRITLWCVVLWTCDANVVGVSVTSDNVGCFFFIFWAELDLLLMQVSMGVHGPWSREQSFSKGGSPLQSGQAGGEPRVCGNMVPFKARSQYFTIDRMVVNCEKWEVLMLFLQSPFWWHIRLWHIRSWKHQIWMILLEIRLKWLNVPLSK